MTAASKLRGISGAVAAAFDPLGDISWFDAWWAEDPAWTNPGDGNNIPTAGLNGNGSDATDFTLTTASTRVIYVDSGSINSQPAIRFSGLSSGLIQYYPVAVFGSSLTETWSYVVIAQADVTPALPVHTSDGTTASNRCIISGDGSGNWRFYTKANVVSSASSDTNAHLFVGVSPSAGNNVFEVDGVSSNASVAAQTLTGVTVGAGYSGANAFDGDIVFQGWYSGDILADGAWADFETWAETHYGLTIA